MEQSPIKLTITKRSLRQRNRGGSQPPTDTPAEVVPAEVVPAVSATGDEDAKHLFSDIAMTTKMLEGSDICAVDLCGDHILTGG